MEYFDGAIDAAMKGFPGAAFIEHTEKLQAQTRWKSWTHFASRKASAK
jgi:hypothetical protein